MTDHDFWIFALGCLAVIVIVWCTKDYDVPD